MSSHSFMATEPDFDLQMRSLAEEAQQRLDVDVKVDVVDVDVSRPLDLEGGHSPKIAEPALLDFLRPLVNHMGSLQRAITENTMAIMRIEETVAAQSNITMLPRLISTLHEDLENRNGVNQKLFDAMHNELRGYKDGFLLEVLHQPIIRDLILLYDDLTMIHRQTADFLNSFQPGDENPQAVAARRHLQLISTNLDHTVHSLIEVLARMDVRRLDPGLGKLDKLNQRSVQVEAAGCPEEDGTVTASLKPGFLWRERTIRPEEVVVKKWRPQDNAAAKEAGAANTDAGSSH